MPLAPDLAVTSRDMALAASGLPASMAGRPCVICSLGILDGGTRAWRLARK